MTAMQTINTTIIAGDPSKISFASLPGELRNQIYSYLTPINGSMHEFQGLVLSCKKIYTEVRPVARQSYIDYLKDVESEVCRPGDYPDVVVSMPASVSEMDEVRVSFSISGLRDEIRIERSPLLPGQTEPSMFSSLDKLLRLHLSKLVIGLHRDPNSDSMPFIPTQSMRQSSFAWHLIKYLHSALSESPEIHPITVREIVWDVILPSQESNPTFWQHIIFRAFQYSVLKSENAAWNCLVKGIRPLYARNSIQVHLNREVEGTIAEMARHRYSRSVTITKIVWSRKNSNPSKNDDATKVIA